MYFYFTYRIRCSSIIIILIMLLSIIHGIFRSIFGRGRSRGRYLPLLHFFSKTGEQSRNILKFPHLRTCNTIKNAATTATRDRLRCTVFKHIDYFLYSWHEISESLSFFIIFDTFSKYLIFNHYLNSISNHAYIDLPFTF